MSKQQEMSTGRALMWVMVLVEVAILAMLVPGDSVDSDVLGTIVLAVLVGIPTGFLALFTRSGRSG